MRQHHRENLPRGIQSYPFKGAKEKADAEHAVIHTRPALQFPVNPVPGLFPVGFPGQRLLIRSGRRFHGSLRLFLGVSDEGTGEHDSGGEEQFDELLAIHSTTDCQCSILQTATHPVGRTRGGARGVTVVELRVAAEGRGASAGGFRRQPHRVRQ